MRDIDLTGIGITLDELDFDELRPLPAGYLDRPRSYQRRGWWTNSDSEDQLLDLPEFNGGAERIRYMLNEIGRAALTRIDGATADDALFECDGTPQSLNQMLDTIDALELERIMTWMDRPQAK